MSIAVTDTGLVTLKGETSASMLIVQAPGATSAKLVAVVPARTASYQLSAGSFSPGDTVSRLPTAGLISAVIPGVTPNPPAPVPAPDTPPDIQ